MNQKENVISAGQYIARFACGLSSGTLNDQQRKIAYRSLLDTFCVAVAAHRDPTVNLARQYMLDFSGNGNAVIWVSGEKVPAEMAAWCNAIASHVLDYDDVLTPMRAHVSAILVPALLALQEKILETSPGFAVSYVAGFEVMAKFSRVMALNHYTKGWHSTSALGILGVTVACCVLLELDESQIVNALGLAVAQASGTRENFGSMAKSFQAGICASAAVRATLLAQKGFTAAPTAIDGPNGFMRLYADQEDLSHVLSTLGQYPLEIDAMGIDQKKYPCCYAIHRALDGVIGLSRDHSILASDIESVIVLTSARGREALIKNYPMNGLQGKFSMEYTLASALIDQCVTMNTYTEHLFNRPIVKNLMLKIKLEEADGPVIPRWSEVTICHRDGRQWTRRVQVAHGDAPDPLSDEELMTKSFDCFKYAGFSGCADLIAKNILDANLPEKIRTAVCLEALKADECH